MRATRIAQNCGYLSEKGFEKRRVFRNETVGVFSQESKKSNGSNNALGSVDVERNVDEEFEHDRSEHAHHGVGEFLLHWVCGWESAVSVDAKVSIDVTTRDRFEFRRTYVSSLSWYFLNFFGLGGVFGLVLGNNTLNDTQQMRQMSMMGMDTGKAFKSVKENLEMIAHESAIEEVAEKRATVILRELNGGSSFMKARKRRC